jgi:cob(I)alamin adenosyltransferase
MSIATKAGDGGTTKLIYGNSISKGDCRVEAYGTIDELNSFLGLARAHCDDEATRAVLERLQRESFIVGSELATPPERLGQLKARVTAELTEAVDADIAEIEKLPGLLDDWALPGSNVAGAAIDVARTVTRRAERCVVRLRDEGGAPNAEVIRYLNRMSDLLWLLGRRYELAHSLDNALRPSRRKINPERT